MWCERVIRNLDGLPTSSAGIRSIDWVDLEWNECSRPLKKQTRSGNPVRMLLSPGHMVHHRDVIYEDASRLLAVNVMPCEVIVAHVIDGPEMALLAMELGNLHLPAHIENGQIAFIENESVMAVLKAMGIFWTKENRRFEPVQVLSVPAVHLGNDASVTIRSQTLENSEIESLSYADDFPTPLPQLPPIPSPAARNSTINT